MEREHDERRSDEELIRDRICQFAEICVSPAARKVPSSLSVSAANAKMPHAPGRPGVSAQYTATKTGTKISLRPVNALRVRTDLSGSLSLLIVSAYAFARFPRAASGPGCPWRPVHPIHSETFSSRGIVRTHHYATAGIIAAAALLALYPQQLSSSTVAPSTEVSPAPGAPPSSSPVASQRRSELHCTALSTHHRCGWRHPSPPVRQLLRSAGLWWRVDYRPLFDRSHPGSRAPIWPCATEVPIVPPGEDPPIIAFAPRLRSPPP